ncbi:hypothetical protein PGB90_005021 [Kerria lacca]
MSAVPHVKFLNLIFAVMLFSRDRLLFFTLIKIFASILIVTAEEFNTQLYLTESVNSKNEQIEIAVKNSSQKKWVSQLFAEARTKFDLNSDVSAECKKDYELYKQHLSNASIWAVRMLESSQWPYVGIFSGITYHLGNWKECVVISEYNVTGKYCLVETTYHRLNEQEITNSENDFPDEKASVWSAIETRFSRSRYNPNFPFRILPNSNAVIRIYVAADERKTLWWEDKISSPSEADGAADCEIHVLKPPPGPISFGKTLREVEKTSVNAAI